MNSFLRRLLEPPAYGRFECLAARVLFAWAAWLAFPGVTSFAEQPHPVGLALWLDLDLTWLANQQPFLGDLTRLEAVRAALAIALVIYLTGRADLFALPVVLFALVSIGTLNNSQGALTHHYQIVSLVALGQWLWSAWRAVRESRVAFRSGNAAWLARERSVVFVSQQVIVGTYMVSAISKLAESGLGWIRDAKYFPLQLIKSERMDYYNTVGHPTAPDPTWGDRISEPIAQAFMDSPNLARAALTAGLALELFAFLGLAGMRANFLFGCLVILFHLSISEVMNLTFDFNIRLLIAFFVVPPVMFGIVSWSRRRTRGAKRLGAPKI